MHEFNVFGGFCAFMTEHFKIKKNDKITLKQLIYVYFKHLEHQENVFKSPASDDLKCQKWLYTMNMHDFNVFGGFCAFLIKSKKNDKISLEQHKYSYLKHL